MSKWKKELVVKIKMLNRDIFVTSAVKSKGRRGRNSMGQFWTIQKDWRPFCKFEEFSKRTSALILKTKSLQYIFIGTYMSSDNNKNNSYADELTIINNAIMKFKDTNTKIIIMGDFNADYKRNSNTNQINDRLFREWLDKDHSRFITDEKNSSIKIGDLNDFTEIYTQRFNNTFLNGKGQYSRIDRVLGYGHDWSEFSTCNIIACETENEELMDSGIGWRKGLSKIWDEANPSDHRPVYFELIINTKEITIEQSKPILKEAKLTWTNEKHVKMYKDELENILNQGDFNKIITENIDTNLR